MFGFGFAVVPLYSLICDVSGINRANSNSGRATVADYMSSQVDNSRTVKVGFDITMNAGLQWQVESELQAMDIHPGKVYTVDFVATNHADHTIVAQAVPGITPWQATEFFNKIECFCFSQQTLAAGESRHMPLRFILNGNLPQQYERLTLSYTFMDTDRQDSLQIDTDGHEIIPKQQTATAL